MAKCSFCEEKLKPGTGILYVKKDGTPFFFCSRKCEQNLLKLKRKPIATDWTQTSKIAKEASKAGKKKTKKEKLVKEKKEKPTKAKKKKVRRKKKR